MNKRHFDRSIYVLNGKDAFFTPRGMESESLASHFLVRLGEETVTDPDHEKSR